MNIQLTSKDFKALKAIATYRYMTHDLLATVTGRSESEMRRRMSQLAEVGLVRRELHGPRKAAVWFITEEGEGLVLTQLKVPDEVNPRVLRHTLGICQLAMDFNADGWGVINDRTISSTDLIDRKPRDKRGRRIIRHPDQLGPTYALPEPGSFAGYGWWHVPDLIIDRTTDGVHEQWHIELELSRKSPERIFRTLATYRHHRKRVIYYTDDNQIRNLINRNAIAAGATDYVWTAPFESTDLVYRARP